MVIKLYDSVASDGDGLVVFHFKLKFKFVLLSQLLDFDGSLVIKYEVEGLLHSILEPIVKLSKFFQIVCFFYQMINICLDFLVIIFNDNFEELVEFEMVVLII